MSNNHQHQKSSHKLRKFHVRKKWLIVGLIVVAITIAAVSVYYLFIIKMSDSQVTNINDITKKVDAMVTNKGYKAGQSFLDGELKKVSDQKEQAQLYAEKSRITASVIGGNDKVKALEYAYKAESLAPDGDTALGIAVLEQQNKNIPNAIKYYKVYLKRTPRGTDQMSQGDYDYYVEVVRKLELGVQ